MFSIKHIFFLEDMIKSLPAFFITYYNPVPFAYTATVALCQITLVFIISYESVFLSRFHLLQDFFLLFSFFSFLINPLFWQHISVLIFNHFLILLWFCYTLSYFTQIFCSLICRLCHSAWFTFFLDALFKKFTLFTCKTVSVAMKQNPFNSDFKWFWYFVRKKSTHH